MATWQVHWRNTKKDLTLRRAIVSQSWPPGVDFIKLLFCHQDSYIGDLRHSETWEMHYRIQHSVHNIIERNFKLCYSILNRPYWSFTVIIFIADYCCYCQNLLAITSCIFDFWDLRRADRNSNRTTTKGDIKLCSGTININYNWCKRRLELEL